jgi:hypothetical protein
MAEKKGTWTKDDQAKAAERGQGAEIGATHGQNAEGQGSAAKPAFAGNKPKAPREKK